MKSGLTIRISFRNSRPPRTNMIMTMTTYRYLSKAWYLNGSQKTLDLAGWRMVIPIYAPNKWSFPIGFWPIPRRPSYLRRKRRRHQGHQGSVWTAIQEEAGLLLGPGQGWHLEMGKHIGKYGEKWEHMTNTIENINMIQHILRDHVVEPSHNDT